VGKLKDLRDKAEFKKPWHRRKTDIFGIIMTIVQLLLKFAAAVCSPDLHTKGQLPYWTICTIVFDALTLISMTLSAFNKPQMKKFLGWFAFVPMLLVEGFATSGKVAWEGWTATTTKVILSNSDLAEPVAANKKELVMAIFWLKIGAATIKAVCAALLLCWKEGSDIGEHWIPAIWGSNQADQTWISDRILDAIIEEARNRKLKGEPTAVGARTQFHDASLANTEIGHINGTGRLRARTKTS
jgi:hypothetical protein